MFTIDNYALSLFRTCPQMYFWRIVRKLVPDAPIDTALSYGIAVHEALKEESLEAACRAFAENFEANPDDDKRTLDGGLLLLAGYFDWWKQAPLKIHEKEVYFSIILSDDTVYEGRIDKVVSFRDETYVMEHKTTSIQFNKFIVNPNSQIEGYMVGLQVVTGQEINKCLVDLIQVTKNHSRYEDGSAFARVVTTRAGYQLKNWIKEVNHSIRAIRLSEEFEMWPKNTGSCIQYMKPCPYLGLCQACKNWKKVAKDLYRKEPWEPNRKTGSKK